MSQPPATGDWPSTAATALADWPTIPGYEIVSELGRGGMGVVYKARQVSQERLVALKLIRDGALASTSDRDRFRIETEAAARMRHPNIVEIYDAGEHQNHPYLAMELIEGGSLDKFLASQPLPVKHAAMLARTLALAVEHAHQQKIIHRDLKPANILLSVVSCHSSVVKAPLQLTTDHGQLTNPKITDFGLAKRLDSDSTAFTQEGAVLGTVGYMAPEQAAGRVREIGPAVDIYALGAILFEMLTGRPPFLADTWQQAVEQILHEDPAPPTQLNPQVPIDLETVCLKCLEKEPGRRYATAGELAGDLSRFLAGKSVVAVPPSPLERLSRLAARDGYQIVREIGRGPASVVFQAQSELVQQPVALKVFSAGVCTQEEWEAVLRRNAETRAALSHPQLVPVHRAGWWDGSGYLAMEYVPGGSLAGAAAGKPLPIRRALRLVEQLTEVVGYLHRQGVVHGNLKPSNVLLAAGEIPRTSDFRFFGGLFSRPALADGDDPSSLGYLAPELVEDPRAEPRPYTDIYGLGTILYELLTGRPPFSAATAPEMLEDVHSRDPVPPSQLNSEVTPRLDACCLRCLRKNPWRRYVRAYDLLRSLRSLLEHPDDRTLPSSRHSPRRSAGGSGGSKTAR